MAEPLRIGVVGLGWVGQARHLPSLAASDRFRLVGVIDRREGRAAEVAAKYKGIRSATASRLADVPWIDEVDAISVATAPMAHHDLVCEALARGLHVITEKPFAMSPVEGEAMVRAAATAQRTLAVVHNFQFARSMKRLHADLASGRIGALRSIRAVQVGNPGRRLPTWYEDLPLGLFYDESPHLLYLLASVVGPLDLVKAVSRESRKGLNTPDQVDAWFAAQGTDIPITLSCNFESSLSEWYLMVHGEHGVGVVDVFRDIYLRLPNDGAHGTKDVIRTSLSATAQHWWQHIASGIPHLTGRLRYGNDEVFDRFARAARGEAGAAAPIDAAAALRTLALQHAVIETRDRV